MRGIKFISLYSFLLFIRERYENHKFSKIMRWMSLDLEFSLCWLIDRSIIEKYLIETLISGIHRNAWNKNLFNFILFFFVHLRTLKIVGF